MRQFHLLCAIARHATPSELLEAARQDVADEDEARLAAAVLAGEAPLAELGEFSVDDPHPELLDEAGRLAYHALRRAVAGQREGQSIEEALRLARVDPEFGAAELEALYAEHDGELT